MIVAIDGWRQALGKKLQHIVAFGDLSDVLDVGRRHLNTEQMWTTHDYYPNAVNPCPYISICSGGITSNKVVVNNKSYQGNCEHVVWVKAKVILRYKCAPADVLAQDGDVVGNDERAEYTRSTSVGRSSDGTIQPGNLQRAHGAVLYET